jgi:hypothetical protein
VGMILKNSVKKTLRILLGKLYDLYAGFTKKIYVALKNGFILMWHVIR